MLGNEKIDNPYRYWKAAMESEASGDFKSAEMNYKAAVMAADNLPLGEYRQDFQDELSKHLTVPGYITGASVSLSQLKEAYTELLTLPFRARIKLADFLGKQGAAVEACNVCQQAFNVGIDPLVRDDAISCDLEKQSMQLYKQLRGMSEPASSDGKPSLSRLLKPARISSLQDSSQSGSYAMPEINQLWENHMQAAPVRPADNQLLANASNQPLSLDASVMIQLLFDCLKVFARDISLIKEFRGVNIVTTEPAALDEEQRARNQFGQEMTRTVRFLRCRASTPIWSVSLRSTDSTIEIFVVPVSEVLRLSEAEHDYCLKARFNKTQTSSGFCWTADGFPLYADDVRSSLRNIMKEVVQNSQEFLGVSIADTASLVGCGGGGLIKRLSELSQQKTNLAEKIVYQQELIQNRIARDLHDTVIADILVLKRSFAEGGQRLGDEEMIRSLENIAQRLRNICSDLAPRDLQDWGLQTVVKDLLIGVASRLKTRWQLDVDQSLPALPHEVELHIFRIIQECLNNTEKYAHATAIRISLKMEGPIFVVTVEDNGRGFDPGQKNARKTAQGGMGLGSIRERVELMRCFYPAQLWIQSQPGYGTKTIVQINVSRSAERESA